VAWGWGRKGRERGREGGEEGKEVRERIERDRKEG
jgi:hypothetical protein